MKKSVFAAALTVAALSATVHADPLLTLTFKIDNVFPTVGSTTSPIPINGSTYVTNGTAVDLQVEVDVTLTGLAPGTSLGDVQFDLDQSSNAIIHPLASSYAWKPNNILWSDDQANANSVFSINEDAGVRNNDLISVTAVINSGGSTDFDFGDDPADPRATLGEAGSLIPTLKLGSFKVTYNPSFGATTITAVNNGFLDFATLTDSTLFYNKASLNILVHPASISLPDPNPSVPLPEPASLSLILVGGSVLATRRRNRTQR